MQGLVVLLVFGVAVVAVGVTLDVCSGAAVVVAVAVVIVVAVVVVVVC